MTIALKQVSEDAGPADAAQPGGVAGARRGRACARCARTRTTRFQDADEFIAALERGDGRRLRRDGRVVEDPVERSRTTDRRNWRRIASSRWSCSRWPRSRSAPTCCSRRRASPCPTSSASARGDRGADPPERAASRSTSCRSSPTPSPRTASPASGPTPGEEADEGSTVTITVSSGPGEAPVPLVQGLPADEAADQLREAGFKSEQRREFSDTVKNGRVIETVARRRARPCARARRSRWSSRAARRRSRCPTSSGSSRDEAEAALRDAELEAAVTEQEDAEAEPGHRARAGPGGRARRSPRARRSTLVVAEAPARGRRCPT